jgi:hypothetical protein
MVTDGKVCESATFTIRKPLSGRPGNGNRTGNQGQTNNGSSGGVIPA